MKLARYGAIGRERPAAIDDQGRMRDLSGIIDDVDPSALRRLVALRRIGLASLPLVRGRPRLGACLSGIRTLYGIGLNYADHAEETGAELPPRPIVFVKTANAICGPNDDLPLRRGANRVDWEVELAVVIGGRVRDVAPKDALGAVAGYCAINDVTDRALQRDGGGGQWTLAKGGDAFASLGPTLVTADEIPNPQRLELSLDLNRKRRQSGSTRRMIFSVARIISHLSRHATLDVGDVIATGTPPGVGAAANPPRFLRRGDVVELSVEGLGSQRRRVV